ALAQLQLAPPPAPQLPLELAEERLRAAALCEPAGGAAGCGPEARRAVEIECPGAAAVDVEVVGCQYRVRATFRRAGLGAPPRLCTKELVVPDGPFEVRADESAVQHGLLTLVLQPHTHRFHFRSSDGGAPAERAASGWPSGSAGPPVGLDREQPASPAAPAEGQQPEPAALEPAADGSASESGSWECVPSERSAAHSAGVSATSSAASSAACASAPPRLEVPRCFLPQTRFLLHGGQQVTAAQLRVGGGDVLQGPGQKAEVVRAARKHPAQERDLVRVQTEGCPYPFVITADHLLEAEGPRGARVAVQTAELRGRRVFDGEAFRAVVGLERLRAAVEVVEVTFESDAAVVLAWLPPRRRPHAGPRGLRPEALVACRGAALDADRRLRELNDEPASAAPARRSLSAGSRPRGPAWITKGLQGHPHSCTPCERHAMHLRSPALPRCKYGQECRYCHLPHAPGLASPGAA
ncbi:unnamed protein product, partial [Prorocentrum cordatum]